MKEKHPYRKPDQQEKTELKLRLRQSLLPQSIAVRIKIILGYGNEIPMTELARELKIARSTVYKWLNRFHLLGIAGLSDAPRSGQPKKLGEKEIKKILRMTVETVPKESTHWSSRLMARYAGVSRWQVQQIWKNAGLKPHILKNYKISKDPHFAEKVIDITGLYLNPPLNAIVLSVDEKTQIQALDRTQPMLPIRPGQVERRTHDYKRNGTASLYAAFDIASGQVLGRVTKRHRSREFLDFLRQIKRSVPNNFDLHVILDNSSTHKTGEVAKWLDKNKRFKLHFTPTSASWLNAVESWFSSLERRSLHRGVFSSVKELRDEIHRYIKVHNKESAKPFKWTKSGEDLVRIHERNKQKLMFTD